MSDPRLAVGQKLDALADMLSRRDAGVIDFLWGDGRFVLVGSEAGEIFRNRADLASHLGHLLGSPATFHFDFPDKQVEIVGSVGWIFAAGTLRRREPGKPDATMPYLVSCIFENVDGDWRWRQFFGSEPA